MLVRLSVFMSGFRDSVHVLHIEEMKVMKVFVLILAVFCMGRIFFVQHLQGPPPQVPVPASGETSTQRKGVSVLSPFLSFHSDYVFVDHLHSISEWVLCFVCLLTLQPKLLGKKL